MKEEILNMVTSGQIGLNETIVICVELICGTVIIIEFFKKIL